jgi:hypothetical protein
VLVWGSQLEAVTYQTTPRTYNATTSAAYYGPRFDYNPATLVARGLLIEEARTNVVFPSENFSTGWVTSGSMSVTANQVGPDGVANSARTITFPAGSDWIYKSFSGAASTQYTMSVWLSGSGTIDIGVYDNVSTGNNRTLITLTATLSRYTFTCTTGAGSVDFRFYIGRVFGAATATSVVVYGAQLEAGAFATSYIPTAATSVARSGDSVTMTGTNFSSWYNASEGSFIAVAASVRPALSAGGVLTHTLNSNNFFHMDSNGNRVCYVVSGGVNVVDLSPGGVTTNVFAKFGQAYKVNDYAAVINAGTVLTDTSGALPSTPIQLLIGDNTSNEKLNGWIASLAYYNTRLPDATLQSLTLPVIADYYFLVDANGDQITDASGNPLYTQPLYL